MTWIESGDAQGQLWDIVIVGSGIGGSTVALAAARKNKKVLVITKKSVMWKDSVHDRLAKKSTVPFLGDGIGGSSALYGMVLERLEPVDFENCGGAWPESLSAWQPEYEAAEKIFGVQDALPRSEFAALYQRLSSQGIDLNPLKLACRQVPGCLYCQSTLCEKQCKITAETGPLHEAIETRNVFLLAGEALHLRQVSSQQTEVDLRTAKGHLSVTARHVVLAAGALRTPVILSRSSLGFSSKLPAIGRYFMRHLIDIYALDWPELQKESAETKRELSRAKAWGTQSFYTFQKQKLGTVQSFGSLPPFPAIWDEMTDLQPWLKVAPFARHALRRAVDYYFSHPIAASILEDEPQKNNRVVGRADGGVDFYYEMSQADRRKVDVMRKLLRNIFGPYLLKVFPEAENNFRLAHACGTCRIGRDPTTSVVNEWGLVHDSENVWIADASVFPSSGGKNPALTVAAHALRLAGRLTDSRRDDRQINSLPN